MHLVGSESNSGSIFHTFRQPELIGPNPGTWSAWTDIGQETQELTRIDIGQKAQENVGTGRFNHIGQPSHIGRFNPGDVACSTILPFASIDNRLDLCAVDNAGGIRHAISHWTRGEPEPLAGWTELGSVADQAGNVGLHSRVSCAHDRSTSPDGYGLHVVTCTRDGACWHTIRRNDGSWLPFVNVKDQCGDPGLITDVTCDHDGDGLQLSVVTSGGNVWHTIRRAGGGWTPFGLVQDQSGWVIPSTNIDVQARKLSCWADSSRMVLWVVTQNDRIVTTDRESDGHWSPWSEQQTSWFPGTPDDIGVFGGVQGWGEHVAIVTSSGGLFHMLVDAGSGDVESQAGERGLFRSVDLAGV
jgi:hypothetical protein